MGPLPLARHPPLVDCQGQCGVGGRDGGIRVPKTELADYHPLHRLAAGDLEDVVAQRA
jgi:hypothetical protein